MANQTDEMRVIHDQSKAAIGRHHVAMLGRARKPSKADLRRSEQA